MKTSRVSRVVQLLTTLQTGTGHTAAELAGRFGVSRRTLFRDLKELQNIGIQPLFSPSQKRYRLSTEQFLPPINLSLTEALSLLLLVHKMRGQIQLPFKDSALLAALKIESNLPPRVRHYCEQALTRISTKASAQAVPPVHPGLDIIFEAIRKAMALRRKIHICYNSLFDGKNISCELSPYHLLFNKRAWYVIGYSSTHKSIRTFKVNRIQEAEMLDDTFIQDEDFDLGEYLGRAWSMIPEGRIYNVRLHFSPRVAGNVCEVKWHDTQKVTRNQDGSATVDFRVDGLGEISWWILGYGDLVEVVAPSALRRMIAEIGSRIAKINNSNS